MSGMFANRAARRRGITFSVLVGLSLVLVAFSSNPAIRDVQGGLGFAFRPFVGAIDGAASTVSSVVRAIAAIDQLRVENQALRAENDRLKNDSLTADELRRENEQLTALLQLKNGFAHQTVGATVIARDSSEFRQILVLDKGTADGIAVGDVVIAEGGALAGRIFAAGSSSSQVLLISDTTSTVVGQLVTSAATGEVTGQIGGVLLMSNVDAAAKVQLGEEVVTAGISLGNGIRSPYPKGLVIGQVVDVTRDANEVVQTVYLEPAASLDRLEYVLVITDYQGGLPGANQTPGDCSPTASGTLPAGEQPCAPASPRPTPTPRH